MQAYLDNSATTRCSERAKDLMVKVLMEDYGNPSSLHTMGVVAERYIKEAKERIAKTLKADEKEIHLSWRCHHAPLSHCHLWKDADTWRQRI